MNSWSFSCIFGDWLEACSLKALPIMEWRTVVNWLTEVRITLLFVAALPLLEELRRFQSRGKTWREIDWGFLLYNTGTISKGKTNQNKSAWQKKKQNFFIVAKVEENLDSNIFCFAITINLSTFNRQCKMFWKSEGKAICGVKSGMQKDEQLLCCNKVLSVSEFYEFSATIVTAPKTAGNSLDL